MLEYISIYVNLYRQDQDQNQSQNPFLVKWLEWFVGANTNLDFEGSWNLSRSRWSTQNYFVCGFEWSQCVIMLQQAEDSCCNTRKNTFNVQIIISFCACYMFHPFNPTLLVCPNKRPLQVMKLRVVYFSILLSLPFLRQNTCNVSFIWYDQADILLVVPVSAVNDIVFITPTHSTWCRFPANYRKKCEIAEL